MSKVKHDQNQNLLDETVRIAAEELQKAIDNQVIWDILKVHHDGWLEVKIPWETLSRPTPWNEVCAWAIEEFGLPGDRYVTHPSPDEMTYLFRDRDDAVLMILKWT